MICEASSLNKYIEKSSNIFFIFGPEIVLRNNSSYQINKFFKEKGFTEKKIITENDYKDIQKVILENAGGSLFGTKTIIEILHKGAKIPKEISNIFEIKNINQMSNIILIIRSSLEKINKSSKWVKEMNALALLVQCNKLKQFEEKIWVKNQLDFMKEADAKKYTKIEREKVRMHLETLSKRAEVKTQTGSDMKGTTHLLDKDLLSPGVLCTNQKIPCKLP